MAYIGIGCKIPPIGETLDIGCGGTSSSSLLYRGCFLAFFLCERDLYDLQKC